MSSKIYYKFKSRKEIASISFDGSSMTIKELRKNIMLHSGLKADDMILKIERSKKDQTGEDPEYKDEDIVKKFVTVVVSRMPCARKEFTRASKIRKPEVLYRKDPYKALRNEKNSSKFHEIFKSTKLFALDVPEKERIKLMMKQSTDEYVVEKNSQRQPMHRFNGFAPVNYLCNRCKLMGHYPYQCPGVKDKDGNPVDMKRLKRPTGIPQDCLIEVSKDTLGAYLTKDGRYVLPALDREARLKGKKEKRPFSEEENPVYIPVENKPVDEIVCPLCKDVMRDAVFVNCCGKSYCQECVTDHVFNPDVKGSGRCPNCDTKVKNADSFIPNPTIREMVRKYRSGAVDILPRSTYNRTEAVNIESKPVHRPAAKPENWENGNEVCGPSKTLEKPKAEVAPAVEIKKPETETSALRGPFINGKRVLKPKPPPEPLVRRSETLKSEHPPPKDVKFEKENNKELQVEIDLGLEEAANPFVNDLREEGTIEKNDEGVVKMDSESFDPKEERREVAQEDESRSSHLMPIDTVSAPTFGSCMGRRNDGRSSERNPSRYGTMTGHGWAGLTQKYIESMGVASASFYNISPQAAVNHLTLDNANLGNELNPSYWNFGNHGFDPRNEWMPHAAPPIGQSILSEAQFNELRYELLKNERSRYSSRSHRRSSRSTSSSLKRRRNRNKSRRDSTPSVESRSRSRRNRTDAHRSNRYDRRSRYQRRDKTSRDDHEDDKRVFLDLNFQQRRYSETSNELTTSDRSTKRSSSGDRQSREIYNYQSDVRKKHSSGSTGSGGKRSMDRESMYSRGSTARENWSGFDHDYYRQHHDRNRSRSRGRSTSHNRNGSYRSLYGTDSWSGSGRGDPIRYRDLDRSDVSKRRFKNGKY